MSSVSSDPYGKFNKRANERKLQLYWLGFMEGVVASGAIEGQEPDALEAEVDALLQHIYDPDANDLFEDLSSGCCASEEDLLQLLYDFISAKHSQIGPSSDYSENDHVNHFLGYCAGINCDGNLLPPEISELAGRLKSNSVLIDNPMLKPIRTALGVGKSVEALAIAIAEVTGECFAHTGLSALGQTYQLTDNELLAGELLFQGQIFVLTGSTSVPRPQLQTMIRYAGGEIHDRVTKHTNYVVYGVSSSASWKTVSHGRKIEYAKTLISRGIGIKFVPEHELEAALKYHP